MFPNNKISDPFKLPNTNQLNQPSALFQQKDNNKSLFNFGSMNKTNTNANSSSIFNLNINNFANNAEKNTANPFMNFGNSNMFNIILI